MRFIEKSEQNISWIRDMRTANILSGILKPQITSIKNKQELLNILKSKKKKIYIPTLIPSHNKNKSFVVDSKIIEKYMFNSNNEYVGVKKFFEFGNFFDSNLVEENPRIKMLIKHTNDLRKLLKTKKKHLKSICAFQTRNIPHLGHEEIIQFLSRRFDLVVINPIVGRKKKGDIRSDVIEKSYKFLLKNFLPSNIMYLPIISDMYYAGPLEAAHHAKIRENLGFTDFIVGRDHAGANNQYTANQASMYIKKEKYNFKINIHSIEGAYYCNNCKKITLNRLCCDSFKRGTSKVEISGSTFRNCLKEKKYYQYSRKELFDFILNKFSTDIYV